MPEAGLMLVVVMVASIVVIVILFWGKGKAAFEAGMRQLQEKGYVITYAYQRYRGPVTWVWGRYREPIPFYLQFSNRDSIAILAGNLGIADIAVGEPVFDAGFIVRSNKPDWAREFLTKERCGKLVRFEGIQFLTGSISNVLSSDYWPEDQHRELRDIWMLRADGKLEEPAIAPYIELACELSSSLERFCLGRPCDPHDRNSAMFEGR